MFVGCAIDFIALNSLNIAFQSDKSGFVSIIGYLCVVYGFLADEFIFQKPITGFDLGGALVIFVVTVGVAAYKLKQTSTPKGKV